MDCLCNSINTDALYMVVFTREVHVKVGQAELFCTLNYHFFPAGIYPLNVNERNTRTRCEICSKLTIKTPKRRLTPCSCVSFINFEHVNAGYFINDYLGAFFRWFRIQFDIFRPNYLESFYCDSPFFRENDTWCSACVGNTAFCFLFLHFMIWE